MAVPRAASTGYIKQNEVTRTEQHSFNGFEEANAMKHYTLLLTGVAALSLSACAGMTDTQQRTLSGAGMGAAGGALIGSISGDAGLGAVLGAGVGAAGGYVYDQNQKSKQRAYQEGYRAGQRSP